MMSGGAAPVVTTGRQLTQCLACIPDQMPIRVRGFPGPPKDGKRTAWLSLIMISTACGTNAGISVGKIPILTFACGHVAPENRKSQAVFACVACKAGPCNADVNAARNIAAGRAVPAQEDLAVRRSVNCEPQLSSPAA